MADEQAPAEVAPHEHEWDRDPEPGLIGWCRVKGCQEMRVGTPRNRGPRGGPKRSVWRELTASEMVSLVGLMMEDLAYVQALQMIHGKERGLARYRYLAYGGPPA